MTEKTEKKTKAEEALEWPRLIKAEFVRPEDNAKLVFDGVTWYELRINELFKVIAVPCPNPYNQHLVHRGR